MIFDVINVEATPHLSMKDRVILVLYDLGICTKEQIKTISGWSENQIAGAIQRIRNAAGKKEAEKWIRSWQPRRGKPFVFALGPAGHAYARELRGEYNGKNDTPPSGQVWHFVGLNQILCRCIKAGLEVKSWLSGRESASWLYHQLLIRDEDGKVSAPKIPLRPDAMMMVGEQWWMIEYDTGTETPMRLTEKFRRYLDLSQMLDLSEIPLLFVTVSDQRVNTAEWAFRRAIEAHQATWDRVFFMKEGQEVEFLRGWNPEGFGTK